MMFHHSISSHRIKFVVQYFVFSLQNSRIFRSTVYIFQSKILDICNKSIQNFACSTLMTF